MGKIPQKIIDDASHIDIINYCQTHGIPVKESGQHHVLIDAPKCYIKTAEPWLFTWYNGTETIAGKSIDFIKAYYRLKKNQFLSFPEAVELLTGYTKDVRKTQLPEYIGTHKLLAYSPNAIAYLCNDRGFDYDFVRDLLRKGKLGQDQFNNCVFPICNDDGKVIAAELHGTLPKSMEEKSWHQYVNQTHEYGYTYQMSNTVEWLVFTECAIDALSLVQLYADKLSTALIITTTGLSTSVIPHYHKLYPNAKMCIAVDNDKGGDDFIAKFPNIPVRRPASRFKDWNDQLIAYRQSCMR